MDDKSDRRITRTFAIKDRERKCLIETFMMVASTLIFMMHTWGQSMRLTCKENSIFSSKSTRHYIQINRMIWWFCDVPSWSYILGVKWWFEPERRQEDKAASGLMRSRKTSGFLTWNRPVLIKACRVQPRAAPSDKSSAAARRVAARTRERKDRMRESKLGVLRMCQSDFSRRGSFPQMARQACHRLFITAWNLSIVDCTTCCETDLSRAVWHLEPCGSFSVQSQQRISLISRPRGERRRN